MRFRKFAAERTPFVRLGLAGMGTAMLVSGASAAPVSLTGAPYTQNFNSLTQTGGTTYTPWVNDFSDPINATLPGWSVFANPSSGNYIPTVSGSPVNLVLSNQFVNYQASSGLLNASAAGGTMASYGSSGSSDRALGSVIIDAMAGGPSSGGGVWYVLALKNDTGSHIQSITIEYDGEQWRAAANQTSTQAMNVQISTSAYSLASDFIAAASSNGWSGNLVGLTWNSPVTNSGGSALSVNGNTDGKVADLTRTINAGDITAYPAPGIAPGDVFYVRWRDVNDSGTDHGLGFDNITISYTIPEPATLSLLAVVGLGMQRRRTR